MTTLTGVEAVANKHFDGDRTAFLRWWGQYGFFSYVRTCYPWQLLPGGKFYGRAHPGPHPAWTAEESVPCEKCLCPVRDCVCLEPAF